MNSNLSDTKYHKCYPFIRFCKITVPNVVGYLKPVEIHSQLVDVYGDNGMVKKSIRQFNGGRTDVHDEARNRWSAIVTDGLVEKK
ncbi:hypothetical protein TNCV_3789521 [Trichonephila clavipes]|nr:hypothetical protein TNCV_3789521 [Trichonephila clavipes]